MDKKSKVCVVPEFMLGTVPKEREGIPKNESATDSRDVDSSGPDDILVNEFDISSSSFSSSSVTRESPKTSLSTSLAIREREALLRTDSKEVEWALEEAGASSLPFGESPIVSGDPAKEDSGVTSGESSRLSLFSSMLLSLEVTKLMSWSRMGR